MLSSWITTAKQNKLQCLQNRKICVWAESITHAGKYEQVSLVLPLWGLEEGCMRMSAWVLQVRQEWLKQFFSLIVFKRTIHYKEMSKKKVESSSPSLALYLSSCRCWNSNIHFCFNVSLFGISMGKLIFWFLLLFLFHFVVCCIFLPPHISHLWYRTQKILYFCGSMYWFSVLPLHKMFLFLQCIFMESKGFAFIYWQVISIIYFYTFFTAQSWERKCSLKTVTKFYISGRAFKWHLFQRE